MNRNEFERLQIGQIIQHKKDKNWVFIVHQNFGDRISAVRSIEVRDPENWETVTEIKVVDKQPLIVTPGGSPAEIALQSAAFRLHEILKNESWCHTIGISDNKLIVYTKKKKHPKTVIQFEGYHVEYKYVGKITPAI